MRPRMTSSESCARVCSRFSRSAADGGRMNTLTTSSARLLAQLLGALPVDIEQHILPGGQRAPRPARAACRSCCRTRSPIRAVRSASPSASKRGLIDEHDSRAPSTSPGRIGRVVADTDICKSGIRSSSMRDSVVLPAPDGDDSTNISPRRSTPSKLWSPAVMLIRGSEPARGIARRRSSSRGRYWSIRDRSTSSSRCSPRG